MREIKLRAWGSQGQGMFPVEEIDFTDMSVNRGLLGCVLMQYTGIKDKNGKEIFEGDIVKHGETIGDVYFDDTQAKFLMREFYASHQDTPWDAFGEDAILEIIGNIYENPELLTNNNK